jgi:ATP-dependent Clp protease ATP-binding subunit ClpA
MQKPKRTSRREDPVIGRDEEIRRVPLTRRTKNNPMLVGEPGKTAIAEVGLHTNCGR